MVSDESREWLTAGEAQARLGVKAQTLYAYVSRGLVRRERVPGGRASRYLRSDVERLATRARRTDGGPGPEIVVDSGLTRLDPVGRLAYRGWDVRRAVEEAGFEQVAAWLWAVDAPTPWRSTPESLAVASAVQGALPAPTRIADRWRVVTPALATADPLRHDRRPAAVAARAQLLIATLVDCLVPVGRRPSRADTTIAARLWPRLTGLAPTAARVGTLDRVLVLLADHDLAASTFAARIAASTWADPYLVVSAGLAAAGGPLHAGASEEVRRMLREILDGVPASTAVGERLRDRGAVPGFGHQVYEGPDPRAVVLLAALRAARPPRPLSDALDAVVALATADGGPHPNIDFALGAFAEATEMVPGGGEAVFTLARCAGWIAHALEEYPHRLRYRIRTAYTGPEPDWS